MKPERNEWPLLPTSPLVVCCTGCWGTWVGGRRPLCTAVETGEKVYSINEFLLRWVQVIPTSRRAHLSTHLLASFQPLSTFSAGSTGIGCGDVGQWDSCARRDMCKRGFAAHFS